MKRIASVTLALLLLLAAAPGVSFAGDCDGQGNASLELIADRVAIGAPFQLVLTGKRISRFSLMADVGSGPVTLPGVGTFCLDLGPRMRILFNGIRDGWPRIRSNGEYVIDLTVPDMAKLRGRSFYVQAVIDDDDAPNGFAISNMVTITPDNEIFEDFSTTRHRFDLRTTAIWDGTGVCAGQAVNRTTTYRVPTVVDPGAPHPLVDPNDTDTPNGCRFQMLFTPERFGGEHREWIVGMYWAPYGGVVSTATYQGLEMKLGHAVEYRGGMRGARFDDNYDGPAVSVYSGNYWISGAAGVDWFPWPAFQSAFRVRGGLGLLVEVDLPSGGTAPQSFEAGKDLPVRLSRLIANSGATDASGASRGLYSMAFDLVKTEFEAWSVYIDSGHENPDYGSPVLDADIPPSCRFETWFQGGGDADGDGNLDHFSVWSQDADGADGYRYLRFRFVFDADPFLRELATVNSMRVPILTPR